MDSASWSNRIPMNPVAHDYPMAMLPTNEKKEERITIIHCWHANGHPIHHWHGSGSIGSLDSLDVGQHAKLAKTLAIWSIGLPIDSLAYFTHWT